MFKNVIGLMSGTSMDGIDAAFLKTDGLLHVEAGEAITVPYSEDLRQKLSELVSSGIDSKNVEEQITVKHAEVIIQLLKKTNTPANEIDLIGFHGHTVFHSPARRMTLQIGDGELLAKLTGVDVVCDFRSNDVKQGGQGAPLVPLYHQAIATKLIKPLAILNLGGVANISWLGHENELLAFDTGPGNALLDDYISLHLGEKQDTGGKLSLSGNVDQGSLKSLLEHPYFLKKAPKSLDRNEFDWTPVSKLSIADGATTLCAFTAEAVARSIQIIPEPPEIWLVTGGGRHNLAMMQELKNRLEAPVKSVDDIGWKGDFLEAQAFGYLAVRSLKGLPLSIPSTTGVPHPLSGGVIFKAVK
ncbi:MAG: anhydro-N-acetylmuramic acid kinase [Deltaproteobacteria bacterium]|jgi:anhydro-N-acetylmuramic acid kinase|nr:anhydro-N-acetylmuramic acid kinase [Deltaproteobacteria bacterium]